jgi:hypothetical protein
VSLYGVDISAYQSGPPKGKDFYFIKATEGTSYTDSHLGAWLVQIEGWGALPGAYHFAHPEDNNPIGEADYFLNAMAPYMKDDLVLCLDHETATSSPAHDAAWAREFMAYVVSKTNRIPWVYCNQSFVDDGRCVGLGSYPLWLAKYAAISDTGIGPWKTLTSQQYTSSPEDEDVFFGDKAAWLSLAAPKSISVTPPTEEEDMPNGELAEGQDAITPIALQKGKCKTLAFTCDNGLQNLPAADVRIAIHSAAGGWDQIIATQAIDSAKGQVVIPIKATDADGISIKRLDAGTVHVAYVAY